MSVCQLIWCIWKKKQTQKKQWHTWTSDILKDDMCVDVWRLTQPDATSKCWQGMWASCGKVTPLTVVFRSRWITSCDPMHVQSAQVVCRAWFASSFAYFAYLHFHWKMKCLGSCSYFQSWTSQDTLGGKEMKQTSKSTSVNPVFGRLSTPIKLFKANSWVLTFPEA